MTRTVLVTGGTGHQGGAVARALLADGHSVRTLVRRPSTRAAQQLAEQGAELVVGDLNDPDTLVDAVAGVDGLFSVQTLQEGDPGGEVRHARSLMAAARAAQVEQIVHTSVSAVAGFSTDADEVGPFMAAYHASKRAAEDAAHTVGARYLTIIRPGVFMENVLPPSMYLPHGDAMVVALDPDRPVAFVAVDDIGVVAAAAFADPARFAGAQIELAGDMVSFRQVAEELSLRSGNAVPLHAGPDEARRWGLPEPMVLAQQLMTSRPSPADPQDARRMGLTLTSFRQWADKHLGPAVQDEG